MDLIIGGAYQGKLTLAAQEYGLTPGDICDLAAGEPALGAHGRLLRQLAQQAGSVRRVFCGLTEVLK